MRFQTTLLLASALTMTLAACATQPVPVQPVSPVVTSAQALPPDDYEGTRFDGVYVGQALDTGVCREVLRNVSVVVENSHARMVYNVNQGFQINGRVTQTGAVTMTGTNNGGQIKFTGQIDGKALRATSIGIGLGATCEVSWTFERNN